MDAYEKIIKVIDTEFMDSDGRISEYNEESEHIADVVKEILSVDANVEDFSVSFDLAFDSPAYESYVLGIAFIYGGQLEHHTFIVEVY